MSRILKNRLFNSISWISLVICCLILVFIITVITWNGIMAIDFNFFMTESSHFGSSGGIYYQIVGSLLMVLVAALICLVTLFSISALFIRKRTQILSER